MPRSAAARNASVVAVRWLPHFRWRLRARAGWQWPAWAGSSAGPSARARRPRTWGLQRLAARPWMLSLAGWIAGNAKPSLGAWLAALRCSEQRSLARRPLARVEVPAPVQARWARLRRSLQLASWNRFAVRARGPAATSRTVRGLPSGRWRFWLRAVQRGAGRLQALLLVAALLLRLAISEAPRALALRGHKRAERESRPRDGVRGQPQLPAASAPPDAEHPRRALPSASRRQ